MSRSTLEENTKQSDFWTHFHTRTVPTILLLITVDLQQTIVNSKECKTRCIENPAFDAHFCHSFL